MSRLPTRQIYVWESASVGTVQEILLIRHAATDMTGALCGHSDPALNAVGREQASALALQLDGSNIARLYSSDLRRAIQTAEPLADLWRRPVEPRSALREISFGDWEGRRWAEIRTDNPELGSLESDSTLCPPGGESFACFRERVLEFLKTTIAECDGQSIAIVTHLGVIHVALAEMKPKSTVSHPQLRIDHCSVHRLVPKFPK